MSDALTQIKRVMFDVDGVFTTGQFLYTEDGKFAKIFGPHDSDGIKLLKPHLFLQAITADERGWNITKRRIVDDMGLALELVSEEERSQYIKTATSKLDTIFMGDSLYDAQIFGLVKYGIAPANAHPAALAAAHYVTVAKGGEGAVGEACIHILEQFVSTVYAELLVNNQGIACFSEKK